MSSSLVDCVGYFAALAIFTTESWRLSHCLQSRLVRSGDVGNRPVEVRSLACGRRQFTEMRPVVGGELAHVPEPPAVGDVADGGAVSGPSQLSSYPAQPTDLEIPFRGEPEVLTEGKE